MGYIQRKRKGAVAHVYFQLYDGSFWEGDSQGLTCDERGTVRDDDCNSLCDLFHTDASIKNFDSIKQIKELLESNSDDFFEKIINPETYKPTALGARIIRNIVPNEESINRLYRSLITIEKRAEWFDVSKLFGYSDVDGDPSTIVASMLKESIKGSIPRKEGLCVNPYCGGHAFEFDEEIPENLQALIDSIFEGCVPAADDGQSRERILKIICFFIDLADLLSNQ